MNQFGVEKVDFETLCRDADIVSLHAPLNESTSEIIDAQVLDLMDKRTTVINAARGGLVDQAALISALEAGEIGYCGLDVFGRVESGDNV